MDRTPEGNHQDVAPMSSSGVNDDKAESRAPALQGRRKREKDSASVGAKHSDAPILLPGSDSDKDHGRNHISPVDAWAEGLIDG